MERRKLFRRTAIRSALLGRSAVITGAEEALAATDEERDVTIERYTPGKPHKGKVLAVIHSHLDDAPFHCTGTAAKLIKEGYTGYLIRSTNNEKTGGNTFAENILSHEQDQIKMAKAVGFKDIFNLYYRQHEMDGISPVELRARLILIFRALKVDTVITHNPWGQWEENPDHWVTGHAVEQACWMAGAADFPEHREAGIMPHSVRERYYWVGRREQPFNRIVDISTTIEEKMNSLVECKSQGGGSYGSRLRRELAKERKRLPLLGNDDVTADREYVKRFVLKRWSTFAGIEEYGLEYGERFYYIDQRPRGKSEVEEYIEKNAVKL